MATRYHSITYKIPRYLPRQFNTAYYCKFLPLSIHVTMPLYIYINVYMLNAFWDEFGSETVNSGARQIRKKNLTRRMHTYHEIFVLLLS